MEVEKVLSLMEQKDFEQSRKELEGLEDAASSEEETAQVLYLQGLLSLEEGDYVEGRNFIQRVVGEYYDSRLYAFGESSKIRVLGAERVASLAGDRGYFEDVIWLQDMLGGDARLDWCVIRNASGKDLGKTKLGDLLEFQKIRAYLKGGRKDQARQALGMAFLLRGMARTDQGVVDIPEEIEKMEESLGTQ